MGQRSEWARLRTALEGAGFTVALRPSGHYAVYRGAARVYTMPGSASDWRSYRNTLSDIRRILGIDLRQRPRKGQK